MRREEIRVYFDEALTLTPDEEMEIQFPSERQAESARVTLSRERSLYTSKVGGNIDILVRRRYNNVVGTFKLILSTQPKILKVIKRRADGTEEEIKHIERASIAMPETLPEDDVLTEAQERENLRKTIVYMRQDNKVSDEELEIWFDQQELTQWTKYKWKELVNEEHSVSEDS